MKTQTAGGMSRTDNARLYNRIKRNLGYAEYAAGLGYLLALLIFGWTFELKRLAMSVGGGPVVGVLIYFLVGISLYELIVLPFTLLSGYVLEKRFGMLNQTFGQWLADLVKGWALAMVLGAAAVETIYLLLRVAGGWWWLAAGGVFALFFLLLAQLAPVLILPLFFKFKPLADPELANHLTALCEKAGTRVRGIYEWGLSSKTRRANAALLGWGRTRRVILSDSLLDNFTGSEIEVILAHELGHQKLQHLPKLLLVQIMTALAAFWMADAIFRLTGGYFGLDQLQDIAAMPLLMLSFSLAGLLAMTPVNGLSRRFERQADQYALELTGLAGSFVSAMERLTAMNLGEMEPGRAVEFIFYSHPSPARRIRAAKAFWHDNPRKDNALY